MADNVVANAGSGGATFAADDISSVYYPRTKITIGADGVTDGDVSSSNPLPISVATIPSHAVTNAGTFAVQAAVAAGATNIAKAEDVASANADVGVPAMAVQKATPANTAGTDGDYEFLQMSAGRVWASAVIDTALPAGTNAIGKLAANSGVDIGDVDVTTVGTITPGTAASSLGKAEDAVAASGDVGVAILAVRRDSASSGVSADGDYANISVDSTGALRVTASAGGTSATDDAAFTAASGAGTPIMGFASSDTVDSGDCGVLKMNTSRQLEIAPGSAEATISATAVVRVAIYDNADAQVTSFGAGTQYTEDAAAAANPVGTMQIFRRKDTLSATEVSADGDNIAANATSRGELYAYIDPRAGTIAKAEDVASADGDVGVSVLAVRKNTAASTSGTDGDYQPLITNTTGHLWVDASGQTLTVGSHAVTNAGTFAVQESGTQVQVDDAAFTPATSKIVMAGFEADETATDSVDEGDGGAARMTLDRKQIVTPQPHTAGGLSTFMASGSDGSSILVATSQVIKASAGQLYGYYLYNPESAVTFVHFYNTASASVTVGTTNPLFTLAVPATSGANLMFTHGVTFSNAGWSIAATTTAGGNTAPATGVSAVIWYM